MTDHGGRLYRVVAPPYSDVANHSLIDHIMWITYADISTAAAEAASTVRTTRSPARRWRRSSTARSTCRRRTRTSSPMTTATRSRSASTASRRPGSASGCASNRYCPNRAVTRGEMATFIDRAFDLPATSTDYFVDDEVLDPRGRRSTAWPRRTSPAAARRPLLPDGLDDPRRDGGLPAAGRRAAMRATRAEARASADRRLRSRSSSWHADGSRHVSSPRAAGGEVMPDL